MAELNYQAFTGQSIPPALQVWGRCPRLRAAVIASGGDFIDRDGDGRVRLLTWGGDIHRHAERPERLLLELMLSFGNLTRLVNLHELMVAHPFDTATGDAVLDSVRTAMGRMYDTEAVAS